MIVFDNAVLTLLENFKAFVFWVILIFWGEEYDWVIFYINAELHSCQTRIFFIIKPKNYIYKLNNFLKYFSSFIKDNFSIKLFSANKRWKEGTYQDKKAQIMNCIKKLQLIIKISKC